MDRCRRQTARPQAALGVRAAGAPRGAGHRRRPQPYRRFRARLEHEGLKPAPEADRATLLRRASLDLTGLPPTPVEIDAFLADRSPDAYEKQVDRLLASRHYGERWASFWLDAARYADSNGYEKGCAALRVVLPRLGDPRAQSRPTTSS